MNKFRSLILLAVSPVGFMFCWIFPGYPLIQSSHAAPPSREYFEQYLPITPFLPPDTPNRNYLQRSQPLPPWKPVPEPPPLFEQATPVEPPEPPPSTEPKPVESSSPKSPETIEKPTLPPVSLPPIDISADDLHRTIPPPEITISPWFTISSSPPTPPNPTGEGASWFSSNAVPSFIHRTTQGGNLDFYIPFSISPGGYNPPPASSVVIYTMPD